MNLPVAAILIFLQVLFCGTLACRVEEKPPERLRSDIVSDFIGREQQDIIETISNISQTICVLTILDMVTNEPSTSAPEHPALDDLWSETIPAFSTTRIVPQPVFREEMDEHDSHTSEEDSYFRALMAALYLTVWVFALMAFSIYLCWLIRQVLLRHAVHKV